MTEKVSTFAARLREGLSQRDMTQAELAKATGLDKSSISRYLKDEYRAKQDAVYLMSKVLRVDPAWLMGYDVPMQPEEAGENVPPGFSPLPKLDEVPLVGRVACGTPITAEQNIERMVSVPSEWRATFTLMCKGKSMEPRIQDGDLVAIHKQPTVENGEVAAVRIGEEATLKRVYLYANYIELRPENPEFESIIKIGAEMADVVIEGKAVGLCRGI